MKQPLTKWRRTLMICPLGPAPYHRALPSIVMISEAKKKRLTYGYGSKPCTPGEHQNSWDLWVFIPLKSIIRGFDTHPYVFNMVLHGFIGITLEVFHGFYYGLIWL